MKSIELVVAYDRRRGIGFKGNLPWPRLQHDMTHFRTTTSQASDDGKLSAVVMGRKTWESIPENVRPLPNRFNIIISSKPESIDTSKDPKHILVANSFKQAHEIASDHPEIHKVFVIGGETPFKDALQSPWCTAIHVTEVLKVGYEVDVFMPELPKEFILHRVDDIVMDGKDATIPTQLMLYTRPSPRPNPTSTQLSSTTPVSPPLMNLTGEQGYLDLIRYCIANGKVCTDRTGVGTISMFGGLIRYNLRNNSFPLFTTKRVFYRGVLEELLWFIAGSTNSNLLAEKSVRIWDGNSSREFLDKRGLNHREVGDLGPVYGFQWRHFGAEYVDFKTDYKGKGFDQLADLVTMIRKCPDSRRLLMSAWNPPQLDQMALPPCHIMCQFRVYGNELSCLLYQRSCDMALGVPFNVASYSLLTYMIAHLCGLVPGDLVHCMGDIHVYSNHVEPLQIQLARTPREQPILRIRERTEEQGAIQTIDDFVFDDFIVEGYSPDAAIKMDMAV